MCMHVCMYMDSSSGELEEKQEGDLEGETIRKQLAVGVKNIQWSYAIFWSISSKHPGVLEWGEGYYNGGIKTRKTVQVAATADQLRAATDGDGDDDENLGLERSEQIRELFKRLSADHHSSDAAAVAEKNNYRPQQEAKNRPSIALSPEDLTDAEWYFLVSMSFVFNLGQGYVRRLPGRTLANNRTIWLCNAHSSDSITFSRSLLAKSASIQTVVCFPFSGGVIEFGTTEKVLEDHGIIAQMKSSLQEMSSRKRQDSAFTNHDDHEILLNNSFDPVEDFEQVNIWSSQNSSIGIIEQYQQQAEESLVVEGGNFGTSQALNWQFIDDGISHCVDNNYTCSSSDSISQNLAINPAKDVKKASFDFRDNDAHYQGIVSTLFKNIRAIFLGPDFRNQSNHEAESGFSAWTRGGLSGKQKHDHGGASQVLLKKALFEVPKMYSKCLIKSPEDNGRMDSLWTPEVDEMYASNALSEKRRRAKLNQRFSILGSLVPSRGKTDKVSILDGTIEYLKELQRKVEELESGKKGEERRARKRKKPHGAVGRSTSNSYGDNEITSRKNRLLTKRKASAFSGSENGNRAITKDEGVSVSIMEKNVSIQIRCRWRENLLSQIMDVTSTLHLDSYSVQSSNTDGVLSVTIGSKVKSSKETSAGMIMQALQRIIEKG